MSATSSPPPADIQIEIPSAVPSTADAFETSGIASVPGTARSSLEDPLVNDAAAGTTPMTVGAASALNTSTGTHDTTGRPISATPSQPHRPVADPSTWLLPWSGDNQGGSSQNSSFSRKNSLTSDPPSPKADGAHDGATPSPMQRPADSDGTPINSAALRRISSSTSTEVSQRKRERRRKTTHDPTTPSARRIDTISATELRNMRDAFDIEDKHNTGSLNVGQLWSLMKRLGHSMPLVRVKEMIDEVDANGNGLLEFGEFVQLVRMWREASLYKIFQQEGDDAAEMQTPKRIASERAGGGTKRLLSDSPFMWGWDCVMLMVTAYVWFTVLLYHARSHEEKKDLGHYLMGPDIIATFIMCVDIGIRASLARVTTGQGSRKLITDATQLLRMYVFSRAFVLDFVSMLPLRFLWSADSLASIVLNHARLLRVFRLSQLFTPSGRTPISKTYISFHFSVVVAIKVVVYFFSFLHLAAIAWYNLEERRGSYVSSVYATLYVLAGAGFGDESLTPTTYLHQWYVCLLVLCTMAINGLVIGSALSFLKKSDIDSNRRASLVETLAVLKFFDVPEALSNEILQFQNYILEHDLRTSYSSVVGSLPEEMQTSLGAQAYIQLLNDISLFDTAHMTLRVSLAKRMVCLVFCPEEYVTLHGEVNTELLILSFGFVDAMTANGRYVKTYTRGAAFGENVVLNIRVGRDVPMTASCKALTYCDVLSLSRASLILALEGYPRFQHDLEEKCRKMHEKRVSQFCDSGSPTNWKVERMDASANSDTGFNESTGQVCVAVSPDDEFAFVPQISLSTTSAQQRAHQNEQSAVGKSYNSTPVASPSAERLAGRARNTSLLPSASGPNLTVPQPQAPGTVRQQVQRPPVPSPAPMALSALAFQASPSQHSKPTHRREDHNLSAVPSLANVTSKGSPVTPPTRDALVPPAPLSNSRRTSDSESGTASTTTMTPNDVTLGNPPPVPRRHDSAVSFPQFDRQASGSGTNFVDSAPTTITYQHPESLGGAAVEMVPVTYVRSVLDEYDAFIDDLTQAIHEAGLLGVDTDADGGSRSSQSHSTASELTPVCLHLPGGTEPPGSQHNTPMASAPLEVSHPSAVPESSPPVPFAKP